MNKITKSFIALMCCTSVILTSSCTRTETQDPTSVTDIDGNVYPVIRVGNALWMGENLRTTRYNDGTAISTGLSAADWTANTSGAYILYDNDPANNTIYGKLYTWHAVSTDKLAPEGWHVATSADYDNLVAALGGGSVAGGKAKSTSSLWNSPNVGATNSSGYSGLPGGKASYLGAGFTEQGAAGYWWCRDERNSGQADYTVLNDSFESFNGNAANKTFGFSVRCVRN